MATKSKKTAPAVAAAINVALLIALADATKAEQFLYTSADEHGPLVEQGLAVVNPTIVEQGTGKIATRTTDVGTAKADELRAQAAQGFGTPAAPAPVPAASAPVPAAQKAAIKLVSVPLPAGATRGGARPETYPFSSMEVGQAFFIPATKDKPNPERSYASTVTSARNRFAEEVPGQTRVNRKNNTVPVTKITRDFVIRRIEDGGAAGFGDEFKGVAGAGVWRTV